MNRNNPVAVAAMRGLEGYQPGKPESELTRELGISNIVKLASNENPLGPSPRVIDAIRKNLGDLSRYPDGSGFRLKTALADRCQVETGQITLGNGSSEVLELIARLFLDATREAVFSEYSFAMFPIIVRATGARARVANAYGSDSPMPYGHDLDAISDLINDQTGVVFVANPNNPTGTYVQSNALYRFLEALPGHVICVVDEAYYEYAEAEDYPDSLQWLGQFPNLIVTRTFSKAYGIAGLRTGYAISNPEISNMLNQLRQPFNNNNLALDAALAALSDQQHVLQSVRLNKLGIARLSNALQQRNLSVIPSVANFLCIDLKRDSGPVFQGLLQEGVIVRPLANYKLPNHLRVTVGTEEENQRFLTALDRVLARV